MAEVGQHTAVVVVEIGNYPRMVASLRRLGAEVTPGLSAADIASAPRLVVPGFVPWDTTLSLFQKKGLGSALKARIKAGLATLVVGDATLLLSSWHRTSPGQPGLGLIPGVVSRLPDYTSRGGLVPIPHLGWTEVKSTSLPSPFQEQLDQSFYFAHDHILSPTENWGEVVAAESTHALLFPAAFFRGNLLALQFNPELSGDAGDRLLSRWLHPLT